MKKQHQLPLLLANLCYTLLFVIMSLCVIFLLPFLEGNVYTEGIFDTFWRVMAFIVPGVLLMTVCKTNFKKALSLNPLPWRFAWRIVLMAFVGYWVSAFLTQILYIIVTYLGLSLPSIPIDIGNTLESILLGFLSLCIMAPLTEEFLFRGVLVSAYRKKSYKWALLFPALLFSLMHRYPLNLPYTFIIGVIMAYVVIKTQSIWAGVLYHFVNNLISFILMIAVEPLLKDLLLHINANTNTIAEIPELPPEANLMVAVGIMMLFLAIVTPIYILLLKDFQTTYKRHPIIETKPPEAEEQVDVQGQEIAPEQKMVQERLERRNFYLAFLTLIPGIGLVILDIIAILFGVE